MPKFNCGYDDAEREQPRPETGGEMIERFERETGQRYEEGGAAMDGIFGYMARVLAESRGERTHDPRDDVVAGGLIRYQNSPEGKAKQEGDELLAKMLCAGVAPDDIRKLQGGR